MSVTVTFEGDDHAHVVKQVQEWLATVEAEPEGPLTPAEAIAQGAEVTKDALRIIAQAAPSAIGQNEVFQRLTGMGYKATDATRDAVVAGLDSIEEMTGGGVVQQATEAGRKVVWQMNGTIAKQLLRSLRG